MKVHQLNTILQSDQNATVWFIELGIENGIGNYPPEISAYWSQYESVSCANGKLEIDTTSNRLRGPEVKASDLESDITNQNCNGTEDVWVSAYINGSAKFKSWKIYETESINIPGPLGSNLFLFYGS